MRAPRGPTIACQQGVQARLLLAHDHGRRRTGCPCLRRLPVLRTTADMPAKALQTIPITWPFAAIWGLDLVGPFKKVPGGYTHLIVAVDKFTKWIEAKPIAKLKSSEAVTFFRDIVYQFGVSNSIITDNGTQFTGESFLQFCDDFNICVDWAAVSHQSVMARSSTQTA
jgi:hypothetical protein